LATLSPFERALRRECKALGLTLSAAEQEAFRRLYDLLARWSARVNLTGLSRPRDIARVLFAESLLPGRMDFALRGAMLDVGSGAGFPALPLAVRNPELAVTMVEANARKAVFLGEAARELKLKNARVVSARLEEAAGKKQLAPPYRVFTLRGVGDASAIFPLLAPLAAREHAAFVFARRGRREDLSACGADVVRFLGVSDETEILRMRFRRGEEDKERAAEFAD
jgi:16S rRNA (guanine527-N7)-methyltransferase